jgi:hypothetical protein
VPIIPDHCKNDRPGKRALHQHARQQAEERRRQAEEQSREQQRLEAERLHLEAQERLKDARLREVRARVQAESDRRTFRSGVSFMITELLANTRRRLQDELLAQSDVYLRIKDLWKEDYRWQAAGWPVLPPDERKAIIAEVWRETINPHTARKAV